MIDQGTEQPKEIGLTERPKIEVSSKVTASPEHPEYTADRAAAIVLAGGKSGLIAAIDGTGEGGRASGTSAEYVLEEINRISTKIVEKPLINSAVKILGDAIIESSKRIKQQQAMHSDQKHLPDTTISAGIICRSINGDRQFLLTANLGDSRVYLYRPKEGAVVRLTKDNTMVQALVDNGILTEEEAFLDERRNYVFKTVGSIPTEEIKPGILEDYRKHMNFATHEIEEGDIYFAVSDGISDNLTPQGLPIAAQDEFRKAYDAASKSPNLKRFAAGLSQRAQNVMTTKAEHAKPDDTSLAVLRVPRAGSV
ncbi:SpoIIE family protein phosphatase [Candidatus Roizmanbacteria bacterium]|nr:SpoIIE family protein phosphatase [Candidatus Roizmanbacteria bacterium]